MRDQRVVFAGAGASAFGIAELIASAMVEDGLSVEEAKARIWTVDSRGLVTTGRDQLEYFKAAFAQDNAATVGWTVPDRNHVTLQDTVDHVQPTILLGVSGTPGTFTEDIVASMARHHERPIVFPLSNPTSQSECTAEEAIRWSDGRAIVATGSPFPPVQYRGVWTRVGQCNNSFIFPGVGLGVHVARARHISDGMFLAAAKALAECVTPTDLAESAVFPQLATIRDCSRRVAAAVIERAVREGHADASILGELDATLRRAMWYPEYLPLRYEPQATAQNTRTGTEAGPR